MPDGIDSVVSWPLDYPWPLSLHPVPPFLQLQVPPPASPPAMSSPGVGTHFREAWSRHSQFHSLSCPGLLNHLSPSPSSDHFPFCLVQGYRAPRCQWEKRAPLYSFKGRCYLVWDSTKGIIEVIPPWGYPSCHSMDTY